MGIRIMTDSTADLNEDIINEYNIKIVPLNVHFGEQVYKDKIEISSDDFFNKLEENEEMPSTSQTNPHEFVEAFNEVINEGDEVLLITLAEELSGTYNSAILAKQMVDSKKVHIVDSKNTSIGLGLLVLKAAKMNKEGIDVDCIINEIEKIKKNIKLIMVLETIKYLKKGGRLSASKALIANFLNVKPILKLDDANIVFESKVRGMKKGLKYIVEYIGEHVNKDSDIMVTSSNINENVKIVINKLKEKYIFNNIYVCRMGSIIGTHAGPGAIGLSIIGK